MAYGYRPTSGVKLKLTKNKILLIFVALIFSVSLYFLYPTSKPPEPIYNITINGEVVGFRADLREASKVPVYPDEIALSTEIDHQLIENITFAFKPVEGENGIYIVESIEMINKLSLVYNLIGVKPRFNAVDVSSYDNLWGKIQNPVIALVHPKYANETSIRVQGHVVYISGKPSNDPKNPYKNLDLATVKFLMVVLGIKV